MSLCEQMGEEMSSPQDNILIHRLKKELEALIKNTESKFLLHDGKIAELCKYLKDNLSNSIKCLLLDMEATRGNR